MNTYALFKDGTVSAIVQEFQKRGSADKGPPIAGFLPAQVKPDIKESAFKGWWSAYHILLNKDFISPERKYYIHAEFGDDEVTKKADGKSAGLAFALKFAHKVLIKERGIPPDFQISATGAISDHTADARVTRVDGINKKVAAAIAVLKEGDLLFYPEANDADLDATWRTKAEHNGIRLKPVATVAEAIKVLLPAEPSPKQKKENSRFLKSAQNKLLFLLGALVVAALILLFNTGNPCSGEQLKNIYALIESGDFWQAKAVLESCLNEDDGGACSQSNPEAFQALWQQIHSKLYVGLAFEYKRKNPLNNHAPDTTPFENLTLQVGDGYRFSFEPDTACYAYFLQFNSEFEVELLFPLSSFAMENHLLDGMIKHQIPAGDNFFLLSDSTHQGDLTLYLIASYWRAKDLEEAYEALDNSEPMDSQAVRKNLLDRILLRQRAIEDGFGGIFFEKKSFLQR